MYEKKSLPQCTSSPAPTPHVLDQPPKPFISSPSISGSEPTTNYPSVDSSFLPTHRSLYSSTATASRANTSIATHHAEPSSQSPDLTLPIPQITAQHVAPPDVFAQDPSRRANEVLGTGESVVGCHRLRAVRDADVATAGDVAQETIPGGRRSRNEAALAVRRAKIVEARQKSLNKAIEGNDWQCMLALWERMEKALGYKISTGPHSCAQCGILSAGSTGLDSKATPKLE